ncbi:hypothetical protein SKAU_G00288690 [Synaphobranchus kaupii]|uniref:Uncharacterized protein n=1 Tax=Synaphobranchus kaupii TaxID=118154 RepID=A0A9Q1ET98_SYNKA|nr:hypothetical protein SKAU_G00288690 [Synaphobranchus kaupii]
MLPSVLTKAVFDSSGLRCSLGYPVRESFHNACRILTQTRLWSHLWVLPKAHCRFGTGSSVRLVLTQLGMLFGIIFSPDLGTCLIN